MAKNVNHVSLIKSTNTAMTSGDSVFIASGQTGPKLPTPDVLIQGEIAVNLAKGVETLSIKNTDNEIVTFSSDKIIKKVIVDNERITAAALNDLEVNKQDVLTPGSGISIVNNVISSTVEDITVDDALSSTSENPVQNKVINNALSNKVNNATYAAYTANTASILSGKQDTMSAGTNISIDDNVISTTFDIDTELSSSSTNPVANSAITKVIEENELITAAALNDLEERKLDASAYTETDLSDLYALSAVVSANSVVTAAALNDLNTRILPTITGVSFNEQLAYVDGGVAYLDGISAHTHAISEVDGLQASLNSKVSGITVNNANKVTPTNGVANLTINANTVGALPTGTTLDGIPDGTNRKLTDYATTIEYYSSGSTHEIRLKNGSTTLATVNANDFIKDGMVDGVTVDEPTSGQNSGVTCLIVTFNTDAGKEDIEIPLSQIFDSSLYYTKVEIDNKLGSGFTGENSGNTVTKVIEDNELAISAALNDLNDRKLDASAYTPTDLSDLYILSGKVDDNAFVTASALNDLNERLYDKLDASAYTQVEVDFELNSGSTNPVANSAITTTILENEEVVAEALADLDSRISGNTTYINQVNAKADTIARSLSGYTPSGYSYSKGEVEVKLNDKLDASAYTPTDLSGYYTKQEIDEDKLGSGFTGDNSGVTVTQAINETETVVAAALNDLNDRIDSLDGDIDALESAIQNIDLPTIDGDSDLWSSGSTGVPATSALTEVLEEIEEVTATALNDLNDKIAEVSGNQLTTDSFKTINNESIIGSGNIEIQGGGGSDANALSGVSVNGTAASVSNKVANITSVPASIVATSATLNFVSNTEKNSWNTVTAKTDTTAFTQHTGDTTVHVTSTEKSTWNGKQDALSCGELKGTMSRSDVSGSGNISIKNTSGEFPTVISEGTYKVVTYMSSTTQSYGLNVTFGGNAYSLTTSNGVIEDEREITITSNKTWSASVSGTVAANTVLIVKLYLISSNVSVLGLVAVSNDYDDLYNKPTIPTSLSDINSAHTHSEYALNTAFTAHTADTTAHVTSAEKSTWNGKQDALSNASVLSGITSQKVTNWDGAATNSHTHSNKTVLDGITSAKVTQWNNAISGVSFNGTTATVSNHVAAITATIPAAPGTLTTTATTAQATATNEALSGNIALHKVSKTGSYNDLNNRPTIPTVSNSTVTLTFNGATVGSFTLNGTGGTIDIGTVIGLPSFSASNNGQILGVVNGALAWVTPTTIYTGTGTPQSGTGNDGDIYLQTS